MSMFRHHKYTWTRPFASIVHDWSFVGPDGAVNFHAHVADGGRYETTAGLEFHFTREAYRRVYGTVRAPDHINCPLMGGPCWHDGTSSYATETLWPMIEAYLRTRDHQMIFTILEGEYRQRFALKDEKEEGK